MKVVCCPFPQLKRLEQFHLFASNICLSSLIFLRDSISFDLVLSSSLSVASDVVNFEFGGWLTLRAGIGLLGSLVSVFGVGSVYVRATVGFGVGLSCGRFALESDSDLLMFTTGFFVGIGFFIGHGFIGGSRGRGRCLSIFGHNLGFGFQVSIPYWSDRIGIRSCQWFACRIQSSVLYSWWFFFLVSC